MKIPSILLVALQMMFIVLLASPLSKFIPNTLPALSGLILLMGGILIALWAAFSLSRSNFTVMPEPVAQGTLVQRGPYRLIRHPMYTAVILCGIGAFIAHSSVLNAVYVVALIAVLCFKLKREESLLKVAYADYENYMSRTSALVPGVY